MGLSDGGEVNKCRIFLLTLSFSGSIKIDTRIEFGDDIAQHVLLRFVLYKKDGNQIVPLAQAMWPLELRSTKSNNKKAEGVFDVYDDRHIETILKDDYNSFYGQKNHQRSLKNKRKGFNSFDISVINFIQEE